MNLSEENKEVLTILAKHSVIIAGIIAVLLILSLMINNVLPDAKPSLLGFIKLIITDILLFLINIVREVLR